MPYHHLSATERGELQALWKQGKSVASIARALGRHRATVWRELRRNSVPARRYDAQRAQQRYQTMRRDSRRTPSLSYLPLWQYVFDKMTQGWSPEQIAGRLRLDFPDQPRMRVSVETLYRSLYRDERLRHALLGYLRRRHPRRRKRGQRTPTRPFIPNRVSIEARPLEVERLERYGDWEGDLLVGAHQQGAVLTLVERKSLLLRAARLDSRNARGVADAVIGLLRPVPTDWTRTLTFDNGTEFYHHQRIATALGLDIYFAHPYAAYERARNENTNGLLRQYLPKNTRFTHLTAQQLSAYVQELNDRPRKTLGYRTPNEVFLLQSNPSYVALEC